MEYETLEGNVLYVRTLKAEELIKEKIEAYLKRGKVRDLYDIFYLIRFVKEKDKVKLQIKKLIDKWKEPLEDDLKTLILFGSIPRVDEMLDHLKRWVT